MKFTLWISHTYTACAAAHSLGTFTVETKACFEWAECWQSIFCQNCLLGWESMGGWTFWRSEAFELAPGGHSQKLSQCLRRKICQNLMVFSWFSNHEKIANDVWKFYSKVHIFWEGHKILWNIHCRFDWHNIGQI